MADVKTVDDESFVVFDDELTALENAKSALEEGWLHYAFVFVTEDGQYGWLLADSPKDIQSRIKKTRWQIVKYAEIDYVQAHRVFSGWKEF